MHLGIHVVQAPSTSAPAVLQASAHAAEALGYRSLGVGDRPIEHVGGRVGEGRPLDTLASLAFVAATTQQMPSWTTCSRSWRAAGIAVLSTTGAPERSSTAPPPDRCPSSDPGRRCCSPAGDPERCPSRSARRRLARRSRGDRGPRRLLAARAPGRRGAGRDPDLRSFVARVELDPDPDTGTAAACRVADMVPDPVGRASVCGFVMSTFAPLLEWAAVDRSERMALQPAQQGRTAEAQVAADAARGFIDSRNERWAEPMVCSGEAAVLVAEGDEPGAQAKVVEAQEVALRQEAFAMLPRSDQVADDLGLPRPA